MFLYYINGLIDVVNLDGCRCRFYKLVGVSVINGNIRGVFVIYSKTFWI